MRSRRVLSCFVLLTACGVGGHRDVAEADEVVPRTALATPAFEVTLANADSTEVRLGAVAATDTALYLLDNDANHLLMIPVADPASGLRRVANLSLFGQRRGFEISSHRRGIGVIGVDGILRLMADTNPGIIVSTERVADAMQRPLAIAPRSDGGWLVAHSKLVRAGSDQAPVDSVVVQSVGAEGRRERRWATERVGPAHPGTMLTDRIGGIGLTDTVVLVGADPARVIHVSTSGVRVDTLLGMPARAVNAWERDQLERVRKDRRARGLLRHAKLPTERPAVLLARRIGRATFVSAQAGERHVSLDLYCDGRFRETLLEDAELERLFLLARGAVAVRERGDGRSRLAYYEWTPLLARCT